MGGGFFNTSESCSCVELMGANGVTSGPSLGAGFLLSPIGMGGVIQANYIEKWLDLVELIYVFIHIYVYTLISVEYCVEDTWSQLAPYLL